MKYISLITALSLSVLSTGCQMSANPSAKNTKDRVHLQAQRFASEGEGQRVLTKQVKTAE